MGFLTLPSTREDLQINKKQITELNMEVNNDGSIATVVTFTIVFLLGLLLVIVIVKKTISYFKNQPASSYQLLSKPGEDGKEVAPDETKTENISRKGKKANKSSKKDI